jgi:ferredoxin
MSFTITVQPSGRSFTTQPGEAMLVAAISQGIGLPYGCKDGACGSCKSKLLEGRVIHGAHQLKALSAAEEAAGTVRWLRPEFQARTSAQHGAQAGLDVVVEAEETVQAAPAAPAAKRPWPTGLPEQIKAVAELLGSSPQPLALADLEARFQARGRWRDRLPVILDTLEALGRARRLEPGGWRSA